MPARFEYQRISNDEFDQRLDALGMEWKTFFRIVGLSHNARSKFEKGAELPVYFGLVLTMFENLPGAIPEARQWAAENIIKDNWNTDLGEFPYLEGDYHD